MKKFIAVTVACLTCSGIYAQRAYEGANLGDNWSIGIHVIIKSSRPTFSWMHNTN